MFVNYYTHRKANKAKRDAYAAKVAVRWKPDAEARAVANVVKAPPGGSEEFKRREAERLDKLVCMVDVFTMDKYVQTYGRASLK